jgi:molecular chaperone Hsp33
MKAVAMSDLLHVFLFEQIAVRGALVQLNESWREIRGLHNYPAPLERLLGESIVASALLASTIKTTDGALILQVQGQGPVSLLVAECSNDFGLRCTARWNGALPSESLGKLFGDGRCAITLGGGEGRPVYQGIVPLESATLAGALENYMVRSEQLDTRLWLFASTTDASGLLLQRVPQRSDTDPDTFNRVVHLGATATAAELCTLSAPALLRRLFPEDDVRLFGGRELRFACTCTRARVCTMLATLGQSEVEQVLAEQGQVEVTCEFCNRGYIFTLTDCQQLFAADYPDPSSLRENGSR